MKKGETVGWALALRDVRFRGAVRVKMGYDEDGGEIKMEFRGNIGEHIPAIWF
jgi:hypothetical protein